MRPLAIVTGDPLDTAAHLAYVQQPEAGAVAMFLGQVRNHDPSVAGEVVALEYSAHPDAGRILGELAARVAGGTGRLAVSHRTGRLEVGEVALVCAVSAAHREEAFARCRELVELVKAELPVWKREILATGEHVWVGLV